MKKVILSFVLISLSIVGQAQNEKEERKSNIQEYTPSKLLQQGQWDIKFFNSIYTQTEQTDGGSTSFTIPRQTFFTNTTEVYTGTSANSRVNIGLIIQFRSNTYDGARALDVFNFEDNTQNARSGLSAVAPSVRLQPFKSIGNFSITSSLFFPLFKDIPRAPYLDKRSYFWETKFFYDKSFGANKWQLFTEVDLGFNFGEKRQDADELTENIGERFANNSLSVPTSVFISFFPTSNATVFVNAQQAFLIGYDNPDDNGSNFSQNYTSVGFGGKYQMTKVVNVEASFGKFIRGSNFQGLGQTFSIGLRALL